MLWWKFSAALGVAATGLTYWYGIPLAAYATRAVLFNMSSVYFGSSSIVGWGNCLAFSEYGASLVFTSPFTVAGACGAAVAKAAENAIEYAYSA